MVAKLAAILDTHRERMRAANHPGLSHGWVFSTEQGTLHKGTPLDPVLRKAIPRVGIKVRLTPHGLRRTFNDLARRVAAAQVVRAITGHITEALTDHYSVVDAGETHAVQAAVLRMVDGTPERESSPQREDLREHRVPGGLPDSKKVE